MNHLRNALSESAKPSFLKGRIFMDIGNTGIVKDEMVISKEKNVKEKKVVDSKQGCIKMNDYFVF